MTIDPTTLSAEERAIVDAAATMWNLSCVRYNATDVYEEALKQAEPFILARRALFAAPEKEEPDHIAASGKMVCPNCGRRVMGQCDHLRAIDAGFRSGLHYTCTRPEPAPVEDSECPHCNQPGEHYDQRGHYTCEPEPAQPVVVRETSTDPSEAPLSETRTMGNAPRTCPICHETGDHYIAFVGGEMTCREMLGEPAPVAAGEIRRLGWDNDGDGTIVNHPNGEFVLYEDHVAAMRSQPAQRDEDAAEYFRRGWEAAKADTQPALRMTEELELVLRTAEKWIEVEGMDEFADKQQAAVDAVRTQAAQGVRLEKVREGIEVLLSKCEHGHHMEVGHYRGMLREMLAELDRVEGG